MISQGEQDWQGKLHTLERRGLSQDSLKKTEHKQGLYVDGRIIRKWILEKEDGLLWNGLIWLRRETSCELDMI
jgi:hypothetical protein